MEPADPPVWAQVDAYFGHLLAPFGEKLDAAHRLNAAVGHLQVFNVQQTHSWATPR